MGDIAGLKDGNFYYVEKYDQVQGMFIDALGALFSVIGQNVVLDIKVNKQNKNFSDVTITKVYGHQILEKEQNIHYQVNLIQLILGVSKDYMIEVMIPPMDIVIDDQ